MEDVMGIAWFKDEATYRRALEIFADPEELPGSFEDWQALVDKQCKLIRGSGNRPLRADIDPEAFLAWCATHGYPPISAARIEFVKEVEINYMKTGKGEIIE